jgi:hypothetical protein
MQIYYINNSFLSENEEDCGWVVKAPYTTNCQYIKFAKTIGGVVDAIRNANDALFYRIPYIMIQACMSNRKEYKIVVFNQIIQYIMVEYKHSKPSKAFSKKPHKELFSFVYEAIQDLKNDCPAFICDGLVRVDIFQNKHGRLVVNEFESLEANYYSKHIDDMLLTEKLTDYWIEKIIFFVGIVEKNSNNNCKSN